MTYKAFIFITLVRILYMTIISNNSELFAYSSFCRAWRFQTQNMQGNHRCWDNILQKISLCRKVLYTAVSREMRGVMNSSQCQLCRAYTLPLISFHVTAVPSRHVPLSQQYTWMRPCDVVLMFSGTFVLSIDCLEYFGWRKMILYTDFKRDICSSSTNIWFQRFEKSTHPFQHFVGRFWDIPLHDTSNFDYHSSTFAATVSPHLVRLQRLMVRLVQNVSASNH